MNTEGKNVNTRGKRQKDYIYIQFGANTYPNLSIRRLADLSESVRREFLHIAENQIVVTSNLFSQERRVPNVYRFRVKVTAGQCEMVNSLESTGSFPLSRFSDRNGIN